jgi:DinB superfamily
MHPRTIELIQYLDEQATVLHAAFESVPAQQRGVRPAPGRWSPAEIVHHVTIVERMVTRQVRGLIEKARSVGADREESSIIAIVKPQRFVRRERRIITGDSAEPRDTNAASVWAEFESARQSFKDVVATGDGLALNDVSAPHPALGPLTGYGWIAFVGAHAARHADQIREETP